jgi:hypothetical protein
MQLWLEEKQLDEFVAEHQFEELLVLFRALGRIGDDTAVDFLLRVGEGKVPVPTTPWAELTRHGALEGLEERPGYPGLSSDDVARLRKLAKSRTAPKLVTDKADLLVRYVEPYR